MNHTPELIGKSEELRAKQAAAIALAKETAAAYARVFSSADGVRVLADLRAKFGHDRQRFPGADGRYNTIRAAVIDGQCDVLREIETAMKVGGAQVST